MWPSSFYIRESVYQLCFLLCKKNQVTFLNSFVSKKIHISYFFSVSKVINKIFRFCCYIWCTFSFFINKNAKIKTHIYNFSLIINNGRIITEVRNSRVTKSSYKTELRKMTSPFDLLTRSRKIKSFTWSY